MNLVNLMMRTCPANAREQRGRQKPPVRQPPPQLGDKHPHTLFPWRLFDEPNDGLKVRPKADLLWGRLGSECNQTAQRRPVRETQGRGTRRRPKKSPSCCVHKLIHTHDHFFRCPLFRAVIWDWPKGFPKSRFRINCKSTVSYSAFSITSRVSSRHISMYRSISFRSPCSKYRIQRRCRGRVPFAKPSGACAPNRNATRLHRVLVVCLLWRGGGRRGRRDALRPTLPANQQLG